jgi:hypothetical protein
LEITSDAASGGIRITGLAHRSDGNRAADWWTEACGINLQERKLYYVWKGRYLDRPERTFEGFGDFSFNESSGVFMRGHGIFAELDLTDLSKARRRTGKLTRCAAEEVEVIQSGNRAKIAELIQKRLEKNSRAATH